jgi:hypothetical protein
MAAAKEWLSLYEALRRHSLDALDALPQVQENCPGGSEELSPR